MVSSESCFSETSSRRKAVATLSLCRGILGTRDCWRGFNLVGYGRHESFNLLTVQSIPLATLPEQVEITPHAPIPKSPNPLARDNVAALMNTTSGVQVQYYARSKPPLSGDPALSC